MMNLHIIKCIWSTEKIQGAAVENKTFENVWRSFSCINNEDEERFYRKFNKKRL
jgi:hypothetical protein